MKPQINYPTLFVLYIQIVLTTLVNTQNIEGKEEILSTRRRSKGVEDEILEGVEEIQLNGIPGFLTIYGNATASILGGRRYNWDPPVHHAIVAANSLGIGRIIGSSHTSFLNCYIEATPEKPGELGQNKFLLNGLKWVTNSTVKNVLIIQDTGDRTLATFLNNEGITTKQIFPQELTSLEDLNGFQAVTLTHPLNSLDQAGFLLHYVEDLGGGLLVALTPWSYTQYTESPLHFGHAFPVNTISTKAGFLWRNGWNAEYAEPTTPSGTYNTSRDFVKNTNLGQVWPDVYQVLGGAEGSQDFKANRNQFISIVEMGLRSIPKDDNFFQGQVLREMREFALDLNGQPVPTPENPISNDSDKLLAHMFNLLEDIVLEPEEIQSHPASYYFPGATSFASEAIHTVRNVQVKFPTSMSSLGIYPQVESGWKDKCHLAEKNQQPTGPFQPSEGESVIVNNRHALWFTTGFYAPAGVVIQIKIQGNVTNAYGVQIGCHTDDISRHASWPRLPIITKSVQIANNEAKVGSGFGGLVYITRSVQVEDFEEVITVSITGVVQAPVYKLGQTSLKKWREEIRSYGAPWGEFETENVILALQSDSAKGIEDPESLLLFWDLVMDAIADLIQIPRERYRQERMVPDVLISAGFMHSGYPIMTFLPEGVWAVNHTRMRLEGSWGHFHELGHNHQDSAWTFSGTGEVTCNLFALYIFNTVLGLPAESGHEMMRPDKYLPLVLDYIQTGTEFPKWQSEPFLALVFYYQIQQEYGWESYKQVFARYNELSSGERPGTDQDKIDLWLIMFSEVVGENLGPFFTSWGIPFRVEALEEISHLPEARIRIQDMIGKQFRNKYKRSIANV